MKRYFISSILFLGAALIFCGCPRDTGGKPIPDPNFYFDFIKKNEKTDFFINNTIYDYKNITERIINSNVIGKASYNLVNNRPVLEFWPQCYIFHGNGDTDTLSVSFEPQNAKNIFAADNLKIFFNGQMVKEFDFKNNSGLLEELRDKNCGNCDATRPGAIIISLPK